MLKLNRHKDLMDKFNKLVFALPKNKELTIKEFEQIFCKYFEINKWKNDIINVIYFLEANNFITLNYNVDGTINYMKIIPEHIREIKSFNIEIIQEWNRPYLEDFYSIC